MRKLPIYGFTTAGCYSLSAGSEWTLQKREPANAKGSCCRFTANWGYCRPLSRNQLRLALVTG